MEQQKWVVTVELSTLEEVVAGAIVQCNLLGCPQAADLIADMMAALHFRRDDVAAEQKEKASSAVILEELEEGEASPVPGVPRGPNDSLRAPPAGSVPAPAPPKVTREEGTQTPQEWAEPLEEAAGTVLDKGLSLQGQWQQVESALKRARTESVMQRKHEEAACLLLDGFLRDGGKEVAELVGNWPTLVADRRAWRRGGDQEVAARKRERAESEAELARARQEAAEAESRLERARAKEAEALNKLRRPFEECAARPTPPPHTSATPPHPTKSSPPFSRRTSTPSENHPTPPDPPSVSERLRRPGEKKSEGESQRQSPEAPQYEKIPSHRCWVCGHPGVRRPRNCPQVHRHPPRVATEAK